MPSLHQQIAILDFGSQYTHLIARRFRELNVLANIYQPDEPVSKLPGLIGIVLSGGPGNVDDNAHPYDEKIYDLNVPILGLCFGHQLLAARLGGEVTSSIAREYGKAKVDLVAQGIFSELSSNETVWMSHGDSVTKLPPGFKILGSTKDCPIAAMGDDTRRYYGLQFHPEVTHTEHGLQILKNFAYNICGAQGDWSIEDMQEEIIMSLRAQVGNKKVFLMVSGGVDSTVAFALLEKALGPERVYGLYVDTGLMRAGETEKIKHALAAAGFSHLHVKAAGEIFLQRLHGITEPEKKRQVIGQTFLDVKDQVINEIGLNPDEWLLGQGTIYPDTIETGGSTHADTIKTHHNQIEAIQKLTREGKVIEPLRDFYKDEVRRIGRKIGLPQALVERQPFPGPGLGIRLLCSDNTMASKITLPQEQELVIQELVDVSGLDVSGIHILPVQSVGVQGDNRTYAHPMVIRTVKLDWEKLGALASLLTNKIKGINRVLVEVTGLGGTPPYSYDDFLMPTGITAARVNLLQQIDLVVQTAVEEAGIASDIWQFPVVLIPYGHEGKESVVLRPIISTEAMTARFYLMPLSVITKIVQRLMHDFQLAHIYYDITHKPPGTIEWE
jgi:GMP synthase (glutamine-hydrolysing)